MDKEKLREILTKVYLNGVGEDTPGCDESVDQAISSILELEGEATAVIDRRLKYVIETSKQIADLEKLAEQREAEINRLREGIANEMKSSAMLIERKDKEIAELKQANALYESACVKALNEKDRLQSIISLQKEALLELLEMGSDNLNIRTGRTREEIIKASLDQLEGEMNKSYVWPVRQVGKGA